MKEKLCLLRNMYNQFTVSFAGLMNGKCLLEHNSMNTYLIAFKNNVFFLELGAKKIKTTWKSFSGEIEQNSEKNIL